MCLLERPSRRNERVEKMLRAFRVNLFALGGVALLVGMFLVYNTVLISILRRRKDVGHNGSVTRQGEKNCPLSGMIRTAVNMIECPYCYAAVKPSDDACAKCGRHQR